MSCGTVGEDALESMARNTFHVCWWAGHECSKERASVMVPATRKKHAAPKERSRELAPWRGSGSGAPSGGPEAEPPPGSRAGSPGAVLKFCPVAGSERQRELQKAPPMTEAPAGLGHSTDHSNLKRLIVEAF